MDQFHGRTSGVVNVNRWNFKCGLYRLWGLTALPLSLTHCRQNSGCAGCSFKFQLNFSDCPFTGLCEAVDLPGSAQPESTHVLQVGIRTVTDHERQQETDPLDELPQCLPRRRSVSLSARFTMPPNQNGRTSIRSVSEMEYHDEFKHSKKPTEHGHFNGQTGN